MNTEKSSNSSEIELKDIERDDLLNIAQVHINAFPESALTKLGIQIIQRYYLWQLIGPHKKVRAMGAFINHNCAGFSFSGEFDGSTSGFIEHNKFFIVKEVVKNPWLILNPLFRERLVSGVKLLKKFNKKKRVSKNNIKKERAKSYGILSIAVSNDYQKMGIGKILMLDAENEAKKCGYEQMHLTVNPKNEKAIRFYENLDWQKFLKNSDDWKGSRIKKLN